MSRGRSARTRGTTAGDRGVTATTVVIRGAARRRAGTLHLAATTVRGGTPV